MTLSNQTKGATSSTRDFTKELEPKIQRTVQSSELIREIAEFTHLNNTDALSAFSMMVNSIKNHLLKGNQVNLGDLGILSPCSTPKNKAIAGVLDNNVRFITSQHLKYEFSEKERLLKNFANCP